MFFFNVETQYFVSLKRESLIYASELLSKRHKVLCLYNLNKLSKSSLFRNH